MQIQSVKIGGRRRAAPPARSTFFFDGRMSPEEHDNVNATTFLALENSPSDMFMHRAIPDADVIVFHELG